VTEPRDQDALPEPASDDLRERQSTREQGDFPAEEGIRSDLAGTGATPAGVAPGKDAVQDMPIQAQDRETEPPGGQATGSGGGYGVGSAKGSGGSGEGVEPAGDDDQTQWLRDAEGGANDDR
jgi:hypothetical protein